MHHRDHDHYNNDVPNLQILCISCHTRHHATGRQGMLGKVQSEHFKQLMSKLHKNKVVSEETRNKQSVAHIGKKQTEESKKKIGDFFRGKKQSTVICPHCGFVGGVSAMGRWHMDNCKFK